MNAYAQRGHLRRALSLYARMKEWRVRPSAHTFSILFNAYANLAQPSPSYLPKLKQLKDQEMPKYGVVPSVEIYNVLLKAYLALDPEKSHQELKSVIAEMQEYRLKPDAITYTLWMATAARGIANNPKATVDVAAAFEVWDEMKKNRVHPNLRGYNELLKICNEGSSEDRDIAFELYKEMLVEGVTPDHHTFDILLMTCWKQRKFELANELFDKAVQLNADNKGKLVELDTHLCNSALRVCTRNEGKRGPGRKSGSAEANPYLLDVISKITKVMFRKHLPYDEETYALLISAYTRAGAKEKATSTFADMQSKGQVRISKKTIGALLVTCRESNDVEEVKKVMDLAKDRRVRLTDSMVEEAKTIFIKNKRYQEWTRVERDLAEWLPTATADYATKGKRRASAVEGGDEDDEDDINNDIEAASVSKHPKATTRRSSSAFGKPARPGPYAEGRSGSRERAREEGPRRPEGGEESARQERRRRWREERSGGAGGGEKAQRRSRPGREPKDRVSAKNYYKDTRVKSPSATGRKSFGGAPKPHAGRRKSPPSSLARNED